VIHPQTQQKAANPLYIHKQSMGESYRVNTVFLAGSSPKNRMQHPH